VEEADRLRRQQVERAQHEADLAQHRFRRVHPDNRLVADVLEAEWNTRLRELADAQEAYARQRATAQQVLGDEQRQAILALATELPRIWRDPRTPARERKRLARLLIEDVTLLRGDHLVAHVRFRGGATHTLEVPLPGRAWQLRQTTPAVIAAIDQLLTEHTDGETAALLNEQGFRSGTGARFHGRIVADLRRSYGLASRSARLRAAGFLDQRELAQRLNISVTTVKVWRRNGLLDARRYDDKGSVLYSPPNGSVPRKGTHKFHPRRPVRSSTGSPE
jgi:hypothetical protein